MRLRNRATTAEWLPPEPVQQDYREQFARAEAAEAHMAEHARLLDATADRIAASDALLARITDLHSHDNLTGCCLTCGRAGPCKTTRILTGESK